MSKFSMSDAKITHNKQTGRVSLSFYSLTDNDELDLLLSLLGAYNSRGRKFDIDGFLEVEEQFNGLLEKCYELNAINLRKLIDYDDYPIANV